MRATGLTTAADHGVDLELALDGTLVDGVLLHVTPGADGAVEEAHGPLVRAGAPTSAPMPTLDGLRAAIRRGEVRSCRSPAQPCPPDVREPIIEGTDAAYVFDGPGARLRPAVSVRLVGGPTVVVEA